MRKQGLRARPAYRRRARPPVLPCLAAQATLFAWDENTRVLHKVCPRLRGGRPKGGTSAAHSRAEGTRSEVRAIWFRAMLAGAFGLRRAPLVCGEASRIRCFLR